MTVYGYARALRAKAQLVEAGAAKVFSEKISGQKTRTMRTTHFTIHPVKDAQS